MPSERLTRQELSWLLTQEARSAAERLRKGVAVLSAPEARISHADSPPVVEPALDALDDAMKMLASLHTGSATRGRRGRIDLAALLWDVAPAARVSIEPGGGTEVFGDEAELRRMLQVLVSSTSPTGAATEMGAPEIAIRREGSDVRVSVTLGPDSSASALTERAWLNRMAVRYGGRLELEGATESMILPADGATDQRELEALRRELFAAQQQGEAYARELASVFAHSREPDGAPSSVPPSGVADRQDAAARTAPGGGLGVLCAASSDLAGHLRSIFSGIGRDAAVLRQEMGAPSLAVDALLQRVAIGSELVSDLARLAQTPLDEEAQRIDLFDLVTRAIRDAEARASRRGVSIQLVTSPGAQPLEIIIRPGAASVLVTMLLDEIAAAAPPGGSIKVSLTNASEGPTLVVEDGPRNARTGAEGSSRSEPISSRRPIGMWTFCMQVLCAHVGAKLQTTASDATSGSRGSPATQSTLVFARLG